MELTIDNRTVEAREGESVLQVALRNGIDIPHFCYHPCLSIAGNCRICLVKVDGRPRLMPSCNAMVAPNMKVETETDDVRRARQQIMQFLMVNHPVDCGICDKAGECRLQDYQTRYGEPQAKSIEPKNRKPKLYELSPRISLDNERCILCSRCVRFTAEISKTRMLGIVERGAHARVDRLHEQPFDDPYSDNVIGICPTGALLSRDFLYKSRVWFLEPVRSACTGCARACSVNVWRRKKEWYVRSLGDEKNRMAYRVTPFENPEINGPWICNKGFDLHKFMARERVLTPMVNDRAATVDDAVAEARRLLRDARNPAALVSAHGANEELEAFKAALGARMKVYVKQDCHAAPGEVVEDEILIRADKNPNSFGAQSLFGRNTYERANGHDVVLVWGEMSNYDALEGTKVIHLTSFAPPAGTRAEVLIPISATLERSGSFCNFEGKRAVFAKVLEKPELAQHASDVFGRLAS
jgi:NADH-quinone oxidoreductase subunit G